MGVYVCMYVWMDVEEGPEGRLKARRKTAPCSKYIIYGDDVFLMSSMMMMMIMMMLYWAYLTYLGRPLGGKRARCWTWSRRRCTCWIKRR